MQKLEQITVKPGEFGTKYRLARAHTGQNRELLQRRAAAMKKNWDDVLRDTLQLINMGAYYIIADGQHRIYTASEHCDQPSTFNAVVWDVEDVGDVGKFIEGFNRGQPFRLRDRLFVYAPQSPWPEAAAKRGMELNFRQYTLGSFAWSQVMRGLFISNAWDERKSLIDVGRTGAMENMRGLWINADDPTMNRVLDAISYWAEIAEFAWRRKARIGTLYGAAGIAVGINLWSNYRVAEVVAGGDRLMRYPHIASLRGLNSQRHAAVARAILEGMNYGVHKNFLTIGGEAGVSRR